MDQHHQYREPIHSKPMKAMKFYSEANIKKDLDFTLEKKRRQIIIIVM